MIFFICGFSWLERMTTKTSFGWPGTARSIPIYSAQVKTWSIHKWLFGYGQFRIKPSHFSPFHPLSSLDWIHTYKPLESNQIRSFYVLVNHLDPLHLAQEWKHAWFRVGRNERALNWSYSNRTSGKRVGYKRAWPASVGNEEEHPDLLALEWIQLNALLVVNQAQV